MEIHILAHGEIDVKVEQQNCSSVLSVVLNEDKPESQGGAFGGIRKKKKYHTLAPPAGNSVQYFPGGAQNPYY